jgi:uroporphyrinogen-III synthase
MPITPRLTHEIGEARALRAILSAMADTSTARQHAFAGMRVLSLESRRAAEIESLIRAYGGDPVVAPAVQEVPLESNTEALQFVRRLQAGEFDTVVFLTGAGVRVLLELAQLAGEREQFIAALGRVRLIARGPKPAGVLRDLNLASACKVGEPHTWREVLRAMDGAADSAPWQGARIAVQEYGAPSTEFVDVLKGRGAIVTPVPVYRWNLPRVLAPLDNAIASLKRGEIGAVLFTAGVQVEHLFQRAEELHCVPGLRAALSNCVLASIGPTTSAVLREHGVDPDFQASHAKMGLLVKEAAERAPELLRAKHASQSRG